jgi:hypothetical protein
MTIEQKIRDLAKDYATKLNGKIDARVNEMEDDDHSHFLIYRVLGVTTKEGKMIDVYQNKGRFVYKYAGSFLEEATKLCFKEKSPESGSVRIPNTIGQRPRTFEIDCLVGTDAIEIKWRDATTDGDHITKEHTRMQNVKQAGYKPIRVMFYYPQRRQAMKIQNALETLYKGAGGEYHWGDNAWEYVEERTGINLKGILEQIAEENAHEDETH